jgi:riboflavin kinase / FMN adenylyltransferase
MQQLIDIEQAQISAPTFLTIGNFDGLHRGHQALLRRLQALAAESPAHPLTGLITFDPHPLAVLRPDQPHLLLTTPQERLDLAATLGIDLGVIQTFTPAIAQLEARDFILLLKRHLNLHGLVVGPDFALGRGRRGDIATLRQLGEELGYTVHVVEPIHWQGEFQVRSSGIREALLQGDVRTGATLLGRFYTVRGQVVEGDRRGRQLGIPTANVQTTPEKLLPANGVYATLAQVQTDQGPVTYPSVTNLGVRPTVDGFHRRLETHLLDFPAPGQTDNLYGQLLQVDFVDHLRGEQRFGSLEALVAQIHADIAQARPLLQHVRPPELV